jgi:hypothetical protein
MLQFPRLKRAALSRARLALVAVVTVLGATAFAAAAQAAPYYEATADSATITPVDTATATQVFGPDWDDDVAEVTAPFAVTVYGTAYTTLTIGTNGYVGLGSGTINTLGVDDTFDFGTPVVSAFTSDLYTADSGGVYMETRGTAPNRQLVIEWDVNVCCDGDPVTSRFQVIFTEGSRSVETLYSGSIDNTGWVGIKRDAGEFTRVGETDQTYWADGTRITYRPLTVGAEALTADDTPTFTGYAADPGPDVTVDVYAGSDTTVAPIRTLTVTPNPDGSYLVTLPAADRLTDGDYSVVASQPGVTTAPVPFTVDLTAPAVSLTGPSGRVGANRPAFTGTTGTAAGDNAATINVYAGTSASGTPVATVSPGAGAFSVVPAAPLGDGTYTAQAVQSDAAGNQSVSTRTFVVDTTAPAVTLTSPAADAQTSPTPSFAGTGGATAADGDIVIDIRSGTATSGDAVQTLSTGVAGDGTFAVRVATALAPGQYTAVARQSDSVGNAAASTAVTFTVVAPAAVTPASQPAPAAPAAPATVKVCQSRRVITKHLPRPSGTRLRVVATLNGRRVKSTIRRRDILIPIDLRGRREGTYTLRVTITRTLKGSDRETVRTVTRVAYRACA